MKRLFAVTLLLAVSSAASAQSVVGSPHDLTGTFPAGTNQVCIYCHAPHNNVAAITPLWNHTLTTQTFTPYTSSTMGATMGQPLGVSKMCLSCHDGVTNLDAYGGGAGTAVMTGTEVMGTDLSNDHPVSITYIQGGTTGMVDSTTFVATLPLYAARVECGSCHNPHDNTTFTNFLRASNAASALCLTCHDK